MVKQSIFAFYRKMTKKCHIVYLYNLIQIFIAGHQ